MNFGSFEINSDDQNQQHIPNPADVEEAIKRTKTANCSCDSLQCSLKRCDSYEACLRICIEPNSQRFGPRLDVSLGILMSVYGVENDGVEDRYYVGSKSAERDLPVLSGSLV